MTQNFRTNEDKVDFDLFSFLSVLVQEKMKLFSVIAIFLGLGAVYAISLPNMYESEALLIPNAKNNGGSSIGAIAGQLGGLASLAGLDISSGGINKSDYALEVMRSRSFLFSFFKKYNVKPDILAIEYWDPDSNQVFYNEDVYNKETKAWTNSDLVENFEYSDLKAYKEFIKSNLSISKEKDSGLIRISVSHQSPFIAKNIVDSLVVEINQEIKRQDIGEANRSIEYLTDELVKTNNVETQKMFYQLIEQQYQTLMLTRASSDYVLKVVDSAILPEKKSSPNRILICFIALVLGALLGSTFVFSCLLIKQLGKK